VTRRMVGLSTTCPLVESFPLYPMDAAVGAEQQAGASVAPSWKPDIPSNRRTPEPGMLVGVHLCGRALCGASV